jgi:hypothetical protein
MPLRRCQTALPVFPRMRRYVWSCLDWPKLCAWSESFDLLFNLQPPNTAILAEACDDIALGFGGTRNVSNTARVVKQEFDRLPAHHLFKMDLGVSPIERAFDSTQVELQVAFHCSSLTKF